MTDDAAGTYEWARRADITAEEAWEDLGALSETADWDVEEMMAAVESDPDDVSRDGAERGEAR